MRNNIFGIFIIVLFLSIPAIGADDLNSLRLPEVQKKPWRFKDFPILAWWPPPGTAALEDFKAYKEAGFTIYPANPDSGFEEAVKLAAKAKLKIMPYRKRQGFVLPKADVEFPADNKHVVGWITHDEPSGYKGSKEAITAVNTLMRQDPTRWTLFNFLPPHAQHNPSANEIIEAAVSNGMPILSYDNYVVMNDGTDRTREHFDNLELFRKASLKYDVPFWAFALSIKHFSYRRPSESDIRWKHYTNLAYGAKGLWYFTYWGPTDWAGWDNKAIVDPKTGDKTELYEYIKKLNNNVHKMGKILLDLTSEDVVHTTPPEGHRRFEKGKYWISDIKAKDALIGLFKDSKGDSYALVVNKLHGMNKTAAEMSDEITLEFAPEVKAVRAVNWLDGNPGKLKLDNQKITIKLNGGTGILLKAN